jgi:hypothetical protein
VSLSLLLLEFEFEFDSLLLLLPSVALPSVALAVRPAVMHASSDWLNTAPSSTQVLEQPGA